MKYHTLRRCLLLPVLLLYTLMPAETPATSSSASPPHNALAGEYVRVEGVSATLFLLYKEGFFWETNAYVGKARFKKEMIK